MPRLCLIVFAVVLLAPAGFAEEVVVTAPPVPQTTYYPSELAMGGIGRGGMFASFGENYTLGDVLTNEIPLDGLLGETRAQFMADGEIFDANLIFVAPGQLAGVYPSDGPTGDLLYRVMRGAEASEWVPARVEDASPGFFTLSQTGQGYGIFTDLAFNLIEPVNSLEVGGNGIAWMSGLGPRGSDSVPSPQPFPTGNMRMMFGGVEADILGASPSGGFVATDQVAFTIAPGTPTGCFVPSWMEMTVDGVLRLTNVVVVSIVPAGSESGVCSDTHSLGAPEVLELQQNGTLDFVSLTSSRVWERSVALPGDIISPFEGPGGGFVMSASSYTYDDWWRQGLPFAAGSCGVQLGSAQAFDLFSPTPIPVEAEGTAEFFPEEGDPFSGPIGQSPDGQTSGAFVEHPIFADVRVRRAIAEAIDINELIQTPDVLLPATWEMNFPELFPYDPDAAAALLEEAGWVDRDGDGVRETDLDFDLPPDLQASNMIHTFLFQAVDGLPGYQYDITCFSRPGEDTAHIPEVFFDLAPVDPNSGGYFWRIIPSKLEKQREGQPGDIFVQYGEEFFGGIITPSDE